MVLDHFQTKTLHLHITTFENEINYWRKLPRCLTIKGYAELNHNERWNMYHILETDCTCSWCYFIQFVFYNSYCFAICEPLLSFNVFALRERSDQNKIKLPIMETQAWSSQPYHNSLWNSNRKSCLVMVFIKILQNKWQTETDNDTPFKAVISEMVAHFLLIALVDFIIETTVSIAECHASSIQCKISILRVGYYAVLSLKY